MATAGRDTRSAARSIRCFTIGRQWEWRFQARTRAARSGSSLIRRSRISTAATRFLVESCGNGRCRQIVRGDVIQSIVITDHHTEKKLAQNAQKAHTTKSDVLMLCVLFVCAQLRIRAQRANLRTTAERHLYKIDLKIDFDKLTYTGVERVRWVNRGENRARLSTFIFIQTCAPATSRFPTMPRHRILTNRVSTFSKFAPATMHCFFFTRRSGHHASHKPARASCARKHRPKSSSSSKARFRKSIATKRV
jgi:hypothetical protein